MATLLVVGGLGLALLLTSLLLGDVLGIDGLDLDGGSLISGPVLGTFLAAFGFAGALFMSATGAGAGLSAAAGLAGGIGMGFVSWRITKAVMNMATDEPVRSQDLRGKDGRVLTAIPANGYGEISVRHAGHVLKLHGHSDEAIPVGTTVVIIEVTSSSAVLVIPEHQLFGQADG